MSSPRRPQPHRHPPSTILFASITFALLVNYFRSPTLHHLLPSQSPISRQCRLISVIPSNHCRSPSSRTATTLPCFWHVLVISSHSSIPHRLRFHSRSHLYPAQHSLLLRTAGCRTSAACNASVPCLISPEDPSDAFWIMHYNHDSKFVVLFNVGLASLFFFVAAIIADGSLFHPHRPGFAVASASILILLALSALIYVLLVPAQMQFSLYGRGPVQSFAYVVVVLLIAAILPAVAVTWISAVVFLAFVFGFLFEHIIYTTFATLYFLASLLAYQISNTVLHLRLVYFRDFDDEAEFDRRLLQLSTILLRRVRNNWFMTRVPRMVSQSAVHLMQNNLPDQVFEQIEQQESVPHIDFDALDHPDTAPTSERPRQSPPQSPPPPTPPPASTQPTDTTPLLQPNSNTTT